MDEARFHNLAVAELDAVYRLAYHLSGSADEADELVQETYLRALKGAEGFRLAEYGIRPWLFKILHNVLSARQAKGRRDGEVLRDVYAERTSAGGASPPSAADGSPADARDIDWDHCDERLKAAVAALPLGQRTVFLLSAVEGLKYREIADVAEVPIGTVMSRLARARETLMAALAGDGRTAAVKAVPFETKDSRSS